MWNSVSWRDLFLRYCVKDHKEVLKVKMYTSVIFFFSELTKGFISAWLSANGTNDAGHWACLRVPEKQTCNCCVSWPMRGQGFVSRDHSGPIRGQGFRPIVLLSQTQIPVLSHPRYCHHHQKYKMGRYNIWIRIVRNFTSLLLAPTGALGMLMCVCLSVWLKFV